MWVKCVNCLFTRCSHNQADDSEEYQLHAQSSASKLGKLGNDANKFMRDNENRNVGLHDGA